MIWLRVKETLSTLNLTVLPTYLGSIMTVISINLSIRLIWILKLSLNSARFHIHDYDLSNKLIEFLYEASMFDNFEALWQKIDVRVLQDRNDFEDYILYEQKVIFNSKYIKFSRFKSIYRLHVNKIDLDLETFEDFKDNLIDCQVYELEIRPSFWAEFSKIVTERFK